MVRNNARPRAYDDVMAHAASQGCYRFEVLGSAPKYTKKTERKKADTETEWDVYRKRAPVKSRSVLAAKAGMIECGISPIKGNRASRRAVLRREGCFVDRESGLRKSKAEAGKPRKSHRNPNSGSPNAYLRYYCF